MGVKRGGLKKNYKWEIWQREVEYEKVQRASVSYTTYRTSTTHVYDFVCAFPEKRYAKDFLLTDVVDYLVGLQRSGMSQNSCARIGHDIAAFWNWMRRFKDNTLPNMRAESFQVRPPSVTTLSEHQFLKLVDACFTQEDRTILRECLIGTSTSDLAEQLRLEYRALRYRWNRITKRAGLSHLQMRKMNKSYRNLVIRMGAASLTRLVGARTDEPLPEPATLDNEGRKLIPLTEPPLPEAQLPSL